MAIGGSFLRGGDEGGRGGYAWFLASADVQKLRLHVAHDKDVIIREMREKRGGLASVVVHTDRCPLQRRCSRAHYDLHGYKIGRRLRRGLTTKQSTVL